MHSIHLTLPLSPLSLTLLLLLPTFLRDSAQHNRDIKTTTQATTIIQISALTFLISHSDLPTSVLSWVQFSPLLFHFLFPLVTQAGWQLLRFCFSLSLSIIFTYLPSWYSLFPWVALLLQKVFRHIYWGNNKVRLECGLLCLFKYFTRHLIIIILMHRPVSRSQEHWPKETKRKVCWAELRVIFREMSSWHS